MIVSVLPASPIVVARPAARPDRRTAVAELTIVVPTFNELENVGPLVQCVERALDGIAWEIVFVDDSSSDSTISEVRRLAACDGRIRCLQRIGRRGLASACIEGILSSSANFVAVMDADLQHDEGRLRPMLGALRREPVDLVIGSRYAFGGSTGEWGHRRALLSALATRLSQATLRRRVADPMSGFFMMRRHAFEASASRLSGVGFKLLLDILLSSPPTLRVTELPYRFRRRLRGDSKLDEAVVSEYLFLLADKLIGPVLPVRFVLFGLVGSLGVLVHLAALSALLGLPGVPFAAAQALATTVAMVGNFLLNNRLTYRDRRLRGRGLVRGLLTFCLVCSVGTLANVGVANALFNANSAWWVAGIAGAGISAVWNYSATSIFTWGLRRRPAQPNLAS